MSSVWRRIRRPYFFSDKQWRMARICMRDEELMEMLSYELGVDRLEKRINQLQLELAAYQDSDDARSCEQSDESQDLDDSDHTTTDNEESEESDFEQRSSSENNSILRKKSATNLLQQRESTSPLRIEKSSERKSTESDYEYSENVPHRFSQRNSRRSQSLEKKYSDRKHCNYEDVKVTTLSAECEKNSEKTELIAMKDIVRRGEKKSVIIEDEDETGEEKTFGAENREDKEESNKKENHKEYAEDSASLYESEETGTSEKNGRMISADLERSASATSLMQDESQESRNSCGEHISQSHSSNELSGNERRETTEPDGDSCANDRASGTSAEDDRPYLIREKHVKVIWKWNKFLDMRVTEKQRVTPFETVEDLRDYRHE